MELMNEMTRRCPLGPCDNSRWIPLFIQTVNFVVAESILTQLAELSKKT